jgi:hypothetical protein
MQNHHDEDDAQKRQAQGVSSSVESSFKMIPPSLHDHGEYVVNGGEQ